MDSKRTYAPLFPVRRESIAEDRVSDFHDAGSGWRAALAHTEPPVPVESEESPRVRKSADRWRFALVWQYEPRDQFEGIEQCPCMTEEM